MAIGNMTRGPAAIAELLVYSSSHILTSSTDSDIIQLVVLAVVAPLRPL